MKIAVVCDVLGEENNGTTVAAMNLIRHLQKVGHEVHVICADEKRKGDENFFVTPIRHFGILDKFIHKVGVEIAKIDEEVMQSALDGVEYIHCMLPFSLSSFALKYAHRHGIPVSAGFHMQAENLISYLNLDKVPFVPKLVYKTIYKRFYSGVDAIHFPTCFIRDVFEQNIGKETNGYVISNGVDDIVRKKEVAKPDEYKDEIVILSVGRYSKEKSQGTLIEAVMQSAYKDKIRLILAGQGLKEEGYKKMASSLPLKPVFDLYDRKELTNIINYADLYVHPAVYELEGIACLEAIMCGKLTIVSDSKLSATRNFAIDDSCIFKAGDPKDLARVIDYWIEHPEKRKEYEERYSALAADLAVEECMKKMDKMIEETIEANKKAKLNAEVS